MNPRDIAGERKKKKKQKKTNKQASNQPNNKENLSSAGCHQAEGAPNIAVQPQPRVQAALQGSVGIHARLPGPERQGLEVRAPHPVRGCRHSVARGSVRFPAGGSGCCAVPHQEGGWLGMWMGWLVGLTGLVGE